MRKPFQFKQFSIFHDKCAMKVGTDGVLLGAWVKTNHEENILDIGTGTGLIAIMLAQRIEKSEKIHAIEIDDDAYFQALENKENCIWNEKISIFHQKIQEFQTTEKYDLIVSNPPYFLNGVKATTQKRHQARHTDTLSFDDLLKSVDRLLKENGKFCLVLPYQEGIIFEEKALNYQLFCTRKTNVRSKKEKPLERLLLQFERKNGILEENNLIIQHEKRNDYTADYIALTNQFYTIM